MNPHQVRRPNWLIASITGLLMFGFLFIGIRHYADMEISPLEQRQIEECRPVFSRPPWSDALERAGWVRDGGILYPPGCEGVR